MDTSMKTSQLYLDMDGVLADFDKTASAILGMDSYKFDFIFGADEMWRRLNEIENLFDTFDPMPDAYKLWAATKHLNPTVLTALPKSGASRVDQQKRKWAARVLGYRVKVITCLTHEKSNFCRPGDVLVDDRAINRDRWQRQGGKFVLHTDAVTTVEKLTDMGIIHPIREAA